ncbi:type II secretion system F family protein [Nonomuraea africana]|uniref:type II secretion system F family protein n=1 Tax=Nonomuraea africana TaxID=46171 RepID=UPI00340FF225
MSMLLAAVACAFMATWLWFPANGPAERLAALRPPGGQARVPSAGTDEWFPPRAVHGGRLDRRALVPGSCAGLVVFVLVGGVAGAIAGPVVGGVVTVLVHKKAAGPHLRRDRDRIAADLPFATDLMVACLQSGQPVSAATEIAATAIGGPLGQRLTWISGQLRLGADPEPVWMVLAREPSMGPLARAMSRAAQSGAPVADVLTRLADDARQASRMASLAAARRVGVQAVAPLGLCFLPAFVLLGIIPVVAGLASGVLIP